MAFYSVISESKMIVCSLNEKTLGKEFAHIDISINYSMTSLNCSSLLVRFTLIIFVRWYISSGKMYVENNGNC